MLGAFKNRRPWATAVICFIFGPEFGMLYLNRGRYAVCYWLAAIVLVALILAFQPDLVSVSDILSSIWLITLPLRAVGAAQGFLIARDWQPETKLRWYAHWYSAFGLICVLPVMLAFGIRTFLYRPFDSPSAAMIPTVNVGDQFFVSRFSYNFTSPQRGDVVAFYMQAYKSYFIKRVVGLPGDHVQMVHGQILLNGERIPLRHMRRVSEPCEFGSPCQTVRYDEIYPGGKIAHILDQVVEGALDNTSVFAVPENSYFVLGDNRDNSIDSREGIGFVPRSAIIGRVAYKYMAGGRWVWQAVK